MPLDLSTPRTSRNPFLARSTLPWFAGIGILLGTIANGRTHCSRIRADRQDGWNDGGLKSQKRERCIETSCEMVYAGDGICSASSISPGWNKDTLLINLTSCLVQNRFCHAGRRLDCRKNEPFLMANGCRSLHRGLLIGIINYIPQNFKPAAMSKSSMQRRPRRTENHPAFLTK